MAQAAVEAGTETVALTPHLRTDFPDVHVEELADRCEVLREALRQSGIPLRLVPAAEVSLPWALEAQEAHLRLATYGQRGTDILIETPNDLASLEQLIAGLQRRGLRVTLGHPERSQVLQRDPARLEGLHAQGVLLQINAGALLAGRGSASGKLAAYLCRQGLADVIASDGHRATAWRPITALAAAVPAAAKLVGAERARWLVSQAPAAIVDGRPLPPPPALAPPRGGRPRWSRSAT